MQTTVWKIIVSKIIVWKIIVRKIIVSKINVRKIIVWKIIVRKIMVSNCLPYIWIAKRINMERKWKGEWKWKGNGKEMSELNTYTSNSYSYYTISAG